MSDSESISSYSSEDEDMNSESERMSYSSDSDESVDKELESVKNDTENALLYESIKTYLKAEHPDKYLEYKDKIKNIVGNNKDINKKKSNKKFEIKNRKGLKEVDINSKHKHKHSSSSNSSSNKLDTPPKRGRGRPRKSEYERDNIPLSRMTKKELQEFTSSLQEKLSKYEKKLDKKKEKLNIKDSKDLKDNITEKKPKLEDDPKPLPNDIEGRDIIGSPIDPYYI